MTDAAWPSAPTGDLRPSTTTPTSTPTCATSTPAERCSPTVPTDPTATRPISRSSTPSISGDGRSVAFETAARNLGPADADAKSNVYVRDLDAGRTRLASVGTGGGKGDGNSIKPSISRDGTRVAFLSDASNLVPGSSGGRQFYVRDLAAGTTAVAGPPLNTFNGEGVDAGVLSADGRHVAVIAHAPRGIAPGAPGDRVDRVFQRDLATGATTFVSRHTGLDGAPSTVGIGEVGGITADGACVTFTTTEALQAQPGSGDFSNVYLRALTPDCSSTVTRGDVPPAVLSRLSVRPARFHVGGRRGGTRVAFRLDRASSVTLAFDRLLTGHRKGKKGKRCSTKPRRGRRCTVVKRVGRLAIAQTRLHAGANTVKFSGKLGRKALAPGRYRLIATPAGGNGRSVTVTVVKGQPKPVHEAETSR